MLFSISFNCVCRLLITMDFASACGFFRGFEKPPGTGNVQPCYMQVASTDAFSSLKYCRYVEIKFTFILNSRH